MPVAPVVRYHTERMHPGAMAASISPASSIRPRSLLGDATTLDGATYSCPRRLPVRRRAGRVAPNLLAARGRYCLRCACWFCTEPPASATLESAAAGPGAGEPASAEPAAWRGVRAPLRSGTRAACWFCAEPGVARWSCSLPGAATTSSARRFCAELSARATRGPATAGAAVGKLAATEPAWRGADWQLWLGRACSSPRCSS